MTPRILIITYNWPPRNAIGSHRPYAWAKYWSESGVEVSVLTSKKQIFDAPLDLFLPELPGVKVYEVPFARDGRLSKYLINSPRIIAFMRFLKYWIHKRSGINIEPRQAWISAAVNFTSQLINNLDIIVSTYGPDACHKIAAEMKLKNPSLFWVADYRDLWSQNPIKNHSERTKKTLRQEEIETVGRRADMISAVSHDMLKNLSEISTSPGFLVRNGFDLNTNKLIDNLKNNSKAPGNPFRIIHTGTIYEGHRDPTPLLDVLCRMLEKNKIKSGDVILEFYGSRIDPIRKLTENPSYSRFIKIYGHVSRDEALTVQKNADLLLLLEGTQIESKGVLTGKIFEYISAGRPIICLGSHPDYEIGILLRETLSGEVFLPWELEKIEHLITECLIGRGLYKNFKPKKDEILRYSREKQSKDFLLEILKIATLKNENKN